MCVNLALLLLHNISARTATSVAIMNNIGDAAAVA
jgi:hypothetical protein